MKLYVPTNWEGDLVERIKQPSVEAVFGKLDKDFSGGGRPSCALVGVSRAAAIKHVEQIHQAGLRFYYLMNASCLGNKEWTRAGHKRLNDLLYWIAELKADGIVVASPHVLQLIRKNFPRFEVSVSCFANVNSVERAKFWEGMGASMITLSQVEVNRNFKLLEQIRKNVTCGLQLLVNDNCIADCPIFFYHNNTSSHASQDGAGNKPFMFDYCRLTCRHRMFSEPMNFIRSAWIRPEDLKVYENIGIDRFKIVDRTMTTDALAGIVRAYSTRSHKGNLFDLFMTPSKSLWLKRDSFWHKFRYFFHPRAVNLVKLYQNRGLRDDLEVYIDNTLLEGFIDHFLMEDCRYKSCASCGYCQHIADKVVRIDPEHRRKVTHNYGKFLDQINSGEIFQ